MNPSKKLADEVDETRKEAEKALEPFVERVKTPGDRVKDVRLTHRLTDTSHCLTDADEMSTQMAKRSPRPVSCAGSGNTSLSSTQDHVLVKRTADTEDEAV